MQESQCQMQLTKLIITTQATTSGKRFLKTWVVSAMTTLLVEASNLHKQSEMLPNFIARSTHLREQSSTSPLQGVLCHSRPD